MDPINQRAEPPDPPRWRTRRLDRTGSARNQRARRRFRWFLLIMGLITMIAGAAFGHGLALATGLVAAGAAAHLFATADGRGGQSAR